MKVIDYLDNVQQLKKWVNKLSSVYGVSPIDIKQQLELTKFSVFDFDTFFLTSTVDDMLPYIKDIEQQQDDHVQNVGVQSLSHEFMTNFGKLPTTYITHILDTLFKETIVIDSHLESNKFPNLETHSRYCVPQYHASRFHRS